MKTFIVSTLLLLSAGYGGFGQINKTKGKPTFAQTPDYLQKIETPIFYATPSANVAYRAPENHQRPNTESILMRCDIDGKKDTILTVARSINFIDQYSIKSMEIFKGDEAIRGYGAAAQKGIILMTLIKGTALLNLSQLFDKYEIGKKDRRKQLYVDGTKAILPPALVYSAAKITSIKKIKSKDEKTFILNMETANNLHHKTN